MREAGEARAAAGAAVGECCSVREGRELGRAGGGSAGEREGEKKRERERERERESAWLWLGLQPSEGGGDGRGRWEGLRSAWDTEPCAAARGPSSHRSLLGPAAPQLGFVHSQGAGGDSTQFPRVCAGGGGRTQRQGGVGELF